MHFLHARLALARELLLKRLEALNPLLNLFPLAHRTKLALDRILLLPLRWQIPALETKNHARVISARGGSVSVCERAGRVACHSATTARATPNRRDRARRRSSG